MHQAGKSRTQKFSAQSPSPRARFATSAASAGVLAASILALGCGQSYRPVVSAINPVGPAGQPTKYAIAVSNPGNNSRGLLTVVDFSGDTTLATPNILANPTYFALGTSGSTAYVINATGSLDSIPVSNPPALLTSSVNETTLAAGANPVTVSQFSGNAGSLIYVPQTGRTSVAALNSSGPSLLQELSVGAGPTYVVGLDGAPRVYALSRASGVGAGQAAAIETTNSLPTISATLPVGNNPVYGVMSTDLARAYVVNKGSGTVSVINVNTNALDSAVPTIPATGILGLNPVWAEVAPTLAELLVVNAGDGVNPGSLSIISIPLCNAVTLPTNPNCNATNPSDAVGFGAVVATVPVGINPVMVSSLRDGSRAYVANSGDVKCGGEGSVSVVNLQTNRVSATICATSSATQTATADTSPALIYGHPNSISATLASPTGKVYVTSGDSRFMTVIRTDLDAVTTHITLQGNGVRVLVTAP